MWPSFKSLSCGPTLLLLPLVVLPLFALTARVVLVGGGGGGSAYTYQQADLLHPYHQGDRLPSSSGQCQGGSNFLSICLGKEEYHLTNVYLPPVSSCASSYVPELAGLASSMRSMILGDFNAHDPAWLSTQGTDARATIFLDQLEDMVVLNGDEPTRIPFTTDSRSTSPDVAFASPYLSLADLQGVIFGPHASHCLSGAVFNYPSQTQTHLPQL